MGEPATPSPKDREETRALARGIVESVRNDEAMPIPIMRHRTMGGDIFMAGDVEEIVFQLAQEITLLQGEPERRR